MQRVSVSAFFPTLLAEKNASISRPRRVMSLVTISRPQLTIECNKHSQLRKAKKSQEHLILAHHFGCLAFYLRFRHRRLKARQGKHFKFASHLNFLPVSNVLKVRGSLAAYNNRHKEEGI